MTFSGHDDSTINIVLWLLLLLFWHKYRRAGPATARRCPCYRHIKPQQ